MGQRKEQNEIAELVRKAKNDYITGTTTISKYVQFSQYENIEKIDAYLNSKFTEGEGDRPFFNIVTAVVNIWYRSTSTARSKIRIKATEYKQMVLAFVATILLQDWMRRNDFDGFLDKWDLTEARYGSAVPKFIEKNGKLIPSITPWNRMISDTVNFEDNAKIEPLWLTPAQLLKNKSYDSEMVEKLLDAIASRETLDGQKKDNRSGYIELFEVHGELPLSYLTGKKKDNDEYVQQMHVISFLAKKDNAEEFDDFTLYKGREAKDPYMLTTLIEEDGRAQGIGAVEYLFDAQWMKNHTVQQTKTYLDIASKLIMQTADANFVGQNALNAIQNGDILVHGMNQPLTLVNTAKADITQLQSFGQQWEILAKEITSTPDAIAGNTQPSGTPFRSVAVANKEAHSLFEVMKKSKKRDIQRMMTEYVIPFLKKQMDTSKEIAALLEGQDIATFDRMYVPNEAIRRDNEQVKRTILSGEVAQNLDRNSVEQDIQKELSPLGNQRFVKPSDIPDTTWKEALKDFEWDVEYDVVDKTTDDDLIAQTLIDLFKTTADPMVQQFITTPKGKLLFNKILEKTNAVSPLELSQTPDAPPQQIPQPTPVGRSTTEQSVTDMAMAK